jgi:hypothetical protein
MKRKRISREARRRHQANWRARHPVLAAWHTHLCHAKRRGIAVLWTVEEFADFCTETGYHILRGDGYDIDRIRHLEPYKLGNVQLMTRHENCRKGAFERWGHKTIAAR